MWTYRSPRPYDPPLTEDGVKQAASVARELIDKVGTKKCTLANAGIVWRDCFFYVSMT